ncbi:trappc4 protein sedlin [Fusarium langsethiae]|uniref:Trappc4 protein sedlin n=1 Tax=Fusarium langsethiae TaxID=179993 RepID=A0A0M9ENQ8_FUSLA|nr:trappc4 protein sedlin [Fusarium langsethiae]GKU07866.1 unnamed protein product [Fusarium langsethiae]GKU09026.1 unnamed protein product [Fusarium langsethiae]
MTPKPKRVTAEHTRDRVRNNQRRHRARKRDYIATLEEKLEEAERTISTLRSQVHDLKEVLERNKFERGSAPLVVEPGGLDVQEVLAVVDTDDLPFPSTGFATEDHDSGEINDTGRYDLPGMSIESTDLALSIFPPAMFPSLSQPGSDTSQSTNFTSGNRHQRRANKTLLRSLHPHRPAKYHYTQRRNLWSPKSSPIPTAIFLQF